VDHPGHVGSLVPKAQLANVDLQDRLENLALLARRVTPDRRGPRASQGFRGREERMASVGLRDRLALLARRVTRDRRDPGVNRGLWVPEERPVSADRPSQRMILILQA
jgi:hypothetical protein